jgi:hypothetical protein
MTQANLTGWRAVAGAASWGIYCDKPEGREQPLRVATINTAITNQEEVARLVASAPSLLAEVGRLREALTFVQKQMADFIHLANHVGVNDADGFYLGAATEAEAAARAAIGEQP